MTIKLDDEELKILIFILQTYSEQTSFAFAKKFADDLLQIIHEANESNLH